MKTRLVLCIEALTVGGAEQMLVAMANSFVARGVEVHLICLAHAGELASRLDPEVTIHVLDKKPGVDLALIPRLRACIHEISPAAINSHLWVANLWTRLALFGSRFDVVVTEHSRDTWKPAHYRFLDRLLARRTRCLIAVSQDTAAFYRDQIGVVGCPIKVINNGVDTRRYAAGEGSALRSQWVGNARYLIGTVGRLVSAKNHRRLLDMFRLVLDAGLDARLVIVGDGEQRSQLQVHVTELDLEAHVTLAGARGDVPDVLAALDLFVLSSDREGHPLTALESQAAGTPVVLTDAGGSADAIAVDGEHHGGLLVAKDARVLAGAVVSLLGDDELRLAMGKFAQTHALLHFDRQQMVDSYEAVFNLTCASSAPRC